MLGLIGQQDVEDLSHEHHLPLRLGQAGRASADGVVVRWVAC